MNGIKQYSTRDIQPSVNGIKTDRLPESVVDSENSVSLSKRKLFNHKNFQINQLPTVGIALSGGGIRSATFSLGVLQALSGLKLFHHIDYISTVSGGSYIGSFLGALFIKPGDRVAPPRSEAGAPEPSPEPYQADPPNQSQADQPEPGYNLWQSPLHTVEGEKAVGRLREFGRYLTPGGNSDLTLGMAVMMRNWAATQFVLGLLPLLLFLVINQAGALSLCLPHWVHTLAGTAVGCGSPFWPYLILGTPTPDGVKSVFVAVIGVAAVLTAGFGVAYWFTRYETETANVWKRMATNAVAYMPIIVAPALFGLAKPVPAIIATILVLAFVLFVVHEASYGPAKTDSASSVLEAEDRVRSYLSRRLASALVWTAVFGVLFAIWSVGQELINAVEEFSERAIEVEKAYNDEGLWPAVGKSLYQYWPLIAPVLPLILTIWGHLTLRRKSGMGFLRRPAAQTALGFSILILWLVIWAAVPALLQGDTSQSIIGYCKSAGFSKCEPAGRISPFLPIIGCIVAIAIYNVSFSFLNLSSLTTLYSARLKRAYIGASNPDETMAGYDQDRFGDQIPMDIYYPKESSLGGPIHLINITVSQTVSDGSNVVAYDRKGKPLHIGPGGIVYEGARPGQTGVRSFETSESLSLSTWVAISGAAASTAIGSMTSLGLSVLAMMTNIRLGYWWKPDVKSKSFRSVYACLLDELRGRFSSSEDCQRWYLTDGGHFENTGVYPLLQRRLPFIVLCDNGADPKYEMDDIVRLLVRARVDLSTEIEFLDAGEIETMLGTQSSLNGMIGEYAALQAPSPQGAVAHGPYAALARIRYGQQNDSEEATGILLVIKPRLCFSEPPEILAYHRRSGKAFPQQTTADQFFDEEQWEAYRRLGEHIGEALFAVPAIKGKWAPSTMAAF